MRHSGFLPLCPWQIFCVVSCWALAPLAVCFAVFRMVRRKSGWGICVLPWFRLFVCCWFLLLWFAKLHVTTGVHVAVFLPTASTHVRTEPLSVIGHTGGKKTSPTSVHFWSSPSLWWMTRLHLFCSSVARWWKLEKHFGAASNERETSRQALRQGVKLVLPSWQSLGAACCSVLPLSSPNPSKRTWPASSAGLCSLLSLWWSVLAAQKPKCSKTDLASLVRGCAPCSPSGVGFGRLAAQILRSGLLALPLVSVLTLSSPNLPSQLGCAPCSPSGGPFWPLSSPNSPKFSKTDLASLVCLTVLEQSKAHGTRNYTIVEVPVECHAEMLRLHRNRQSAVVGEQAVEVLSSSSRTDLRSTQSQRDMVSPEIPQLIARKTIQRSAL